MRIVSFGLVLAVLISACGPTQSPEQRAATNETKARVAAAKSNSQQTAVNGKPFKVSVDTGREFAFVEGTGPAIPYGIAEVETAARQATGCRSKLDAGVLAFVGGFQQANLREIQDKSRGFPGWRVSLQC